jgi:hypothetical protein
LLKAIGLGLGSLLLVAAVSAVGLYADIRRIGCESGGQILGPASSSGYGISNASQPGAHFISLAEFEQRDIQFRALCA